MKFLTNILLVAAIIVYAFLPVFDVQLMHSNWTGIVYTAETLSSETASWGTRLFALLPFVSIFVAILLNCMKNRYWGLAVAAVISVAIYFFKEAHEMAHIQSPEMLNIIGVCSAFNVSALLVCLALLSAVISVFPWAPEYHVRRPHIHRSQSGEKAN